jgi:hypothetical protein
MTKLLDKAIEGARTPPAETHDAVAVAVLAVAEESPIALDDATRAAIREGLEQARRALKLDNISRHSHSHLRRNRR